MNNDSHARCNTGNRNRDLYQTQEQEMKQSAHAIRAAKNRNKWGRAATSAYLRDNNVPMRLYQLAIVLNAGV